MKRGRLELFVRRLLGLGQELKFVLLGVFFIGWGLYQFSWMGLGAVLLGCFLLFLGYAFSRW